MGSIKTCSILQFICKTHHPTSTHPIVEPAISKTNFPTTQQSDVWHHWEKVILHFYPSNLAFMIYTRLNVRRITIVAIGQMRGVISACIVARCFTSLQRKIHVAFIKGTTTMPSWFDCKRTFMQKHKLNAYTDIKATMNAANEAPAFWRVGFGPEPVFFLFRSYGHAWKVMLQRAGRTSSFISSPFQVDKYWSRLPFWTLPSRSTGKCFSCHMNIISISCLNAAWHCM